MIECFEDGDLSFDAEGILFGFDLMLVQYFHCHLLVGGDMECPFDLAEGAAADGLLEFEGAGLGIMHTEGIL